MNTTITTADLPAKLQEKVKTICTRENLDPERIRFTRRNRYYYAMTEAGENTGWGYYPIVNEID